MVRHGPTEHPRIQPPPPPGELAGFLVPVLRRHGVVLAYLHGSSARGMAHAHSDVDLAVRLGDDLDPRNRRRRLVSLQSDVAEALGRDDVDLVDLDRIPPLLACQVVRTGLPIVDVDPEARIAFEVQALSRYFDFAPLEQAINRDMYRRLAEGRFGR